MKKMIIIFSLLLPSIGCGYLMEAKQVAREELGPRELLRKYEWFKDAAAQLDAKLASLKVYELRMNALSEAYDEEPRTEWAREDRQQYNQWLVELAGLSANYNNLAAEYNAAMAKENWRFTEVGRLPEGATQALPRSFKPYLEK